jgi:dihydroorotate dehydrogenase
MNWFYRHLLRPVLFAQDPEDIHRFTMKMLGWASRHPMAADAMRSFFASPELPITAFGLRFPNPIGLAAGLDKEGEAVPIWPSMGFGHSELGAITWEAQPGNPAPRLFRAIADEAIVNRMGFNNHGAQVMADTLAYWRKNGRWPRHPVGINLGKNKNTPLEDAPENYAKTFRILWPHADFFVINVSSPNTPNLRELQNKTALDRIIVALQETERETAATVKTDSQSSPHKGCDCHRQDPILHKPLLIKVAPDLTLEALDDVIALALSRNIDGIVATNTTIERPKTQNADCLRVYGETGGLSGKPLKARSTEVIRHIYKQAQGKLPIMGVGGIFTADDAWEKIAAGASVLQIYTSLVYEGPGAARKIVSGLIERLETSGMKSLDQAVGCENR